MVNLSQRASISTGFLGLQASFHLSCIPSVCLPLHCFLPPPCDHTTTTPLSERCQKAFVCISNETKVQKPTGKKQIQLYFPGSSPFLTAEDVKLVHRWKSQHFPTCLQWKSFPLDAHILASPFGVIFVVSVFLVV